MQDSLSGVLVISLEQALAAPFASCRLALAGARVIKAERPEGDFARRYDRYAKGESAYFSWLNHGKESITVSLRTDEDRALLKRMLLRADVFIQNMSPGTLGKHGLGAADLRTANPRLITCSISGYGDEGPYRDMKAYDLLIQAETGLCSVTGTADAPARVGVSLCDISTGMYAYQAILEALYARERTGQGREIGISMFDSVADWMNVPYLQYAYSGYVQPRTGLHHPTITPYGAYPCANDEPLFVAVQNEDEWTRFCITVLQQSALAADPRFLTTSDRAKQRATLDALITLVFAALPREQVAARCEEARVAYARYNTLADLAVHPQVRFMPVETPAGRLDLLTPPGWKHDPADAPRRVPSAGEHGAALRREFAHQQKQEMPCL